MADSRPIKNSFSFYAADMTALDERVAGLKKAGVNARSATVLRALIHLTAPAEMIAHTVRLAGDRALGVAATDDETIAGHPTVNLPKEDVKKLDGVVAHLAKAKIIATRALTWCGPSCARRPMGKRSRPPWRNFSRTSRTSRADSRSSDWSKRPEPMADAARIAHLRGLDAFLRAHLRGQDHVLARAASGLHAWRTGANQPGTARAACSSQSVPPAPAKRNSSSLPRATCSAKTGCGDFDLSEYQRSDAVERLLGADTADSGAIGRAATGVSPRVWLFDELEKAHPKVLDLLIQMLEPGQITLANGETVSLRSDYVAFTSNLGATESMRMASSSPASVGKRCCDGWPSHCDPSCWRAFRTSWCSRGLVTTCSAKSPACTWRTKSRD